MTKNQDIDVNPRIGKMSNVAKTGENPLYYPHGSCSCALIYQIQEGEQAIYSRLGVTTQSLHLSLKVQVDKITP